MYQKTFALTVRALRVDARQLSPHLMRAGLAGFVLLSLSSAQVSFGTQAPGLNLFRLIVYTNIGFASLIVPMLFASAITEEKEERMLPLLQIAGVSPLTILIGKSIPRLMSVLLILVIQLPFSLLAVTLGGVTLSQIFASYLAIAAYTFFVGALSLWCSVIFRLTANSMGLAGLLLLGYHIVPLVVYGLLTAMSFDPTWSNFANSGLVILNGYWKTTIFTQISNIFVAGTSPNFLTWQVGTNLAAALFFFLLSWATFNLFNRETDTAPVKRKSRSKARQADSNRAWNAALVWKDYYFVAGGVKFAVAKIVLYAAVVLFIAMVQANWNWRQIEPDELALIIASLMFFFFLPLEIIRAVSRTFESEVKAKTLSSLMMLPKSTRQIAYAKLLGVFLGLIPVLTYIGLAVMTRPSMLNDIVKNISEEPLVALILSANILAHLLFYLHLVAWLSLRMNGWWSIFVAWLIHYFGISIPFSAMTLAWTIFGVPLPDGTEYLLGFLAAAVVFGAVVFLHINIGKQLEAKAAEA